MQLKKEKTTDLEMDLSLSQKIHLSLQSKDKMNFSIMMNPKLKISNQNEVYYLLPESILYVEADGNYCDIHLTDGDVLEAVSFQRSEIARMIDTQLVHSVACKFAMVGRKHLINIEYIMHIQPSKGLITFDVNQPGTCKKQNIKPSVKSVQLLRDALDDRSCNLTVIQGRNHAQNTKAVNGGFTQYIDSQSSEEKCYDIEDDEIMFLG